MNKQKIQKTLSELFTTVKKNGSDDVTCFNDDAMTEGNEAYPVYKAVNKAMFDSNLSFNFSYEIATRAVDVLTESEDWEDEDALNEAIDAICPIYTYDIMRIYTADSWAVDEAVDELGQGGDSSKNALYGWYNLITAMAYAIKSNIEAIIEDE